MNKFLLVAATLTLGGCSINGVTWDPNRSTAGIAPDYLQLTPDEQIIWAGLTDEERQRAILFVTNGATLVSSLGSQ